MKSKENKIEIKLKQKENSLIKLNAKFSKLSHLNKTLSNKLKEAKKQATIHHHREDFLKCELLKLNPDYNFDDSIKFIEKNRIRKRDNNLCCFCGRNIYEVGFDETLHHKNPRRYGGLDTPDNLITICPECHELLEMLIKEVEESMKKFYSIK